MLFDFVVNVIFVIQGTLRSAGNGVVTYSEPSIADVTKYYANSRAEILQDEAKQAREMKP